MSADQERSAVDIFSGIGGFALACEWAAVETIAFAEINSDASRIINKRFPGRPNYGDVRNVPALSAWLLTGGVPCQPASSAGKRLGAADDRWLWPEALAVVERGSYEWVLFENPTGILSLNDGLEFERICLALESQGYEVQPIVIPACAVGAFHRRNRVWIIAHSAGVRRERLTRRESDGTEKQGRLSELGAGSSVMVNAHGAREPQPSRYQSNERQRSIHGGQVIRDPTIKGLPNWAGGTMGQPHPLTEFERPSGREIERDFCGVAHGVSRRVDRLRELGNAIVPQVVCGLVRRMIECEMN